MITKLVVTKMFGRCAEGLSPVATSNWRPTEAYLAGRGHIPTKKGGRENGTRKEMNVPGKEKE